MAGGYRAGPQGRDRAEKQRGATDAGGGGQGRGDGGQVRAVSGSTPAPSAGQRARPRRRGATTGAGGWGERSMGPRPPSPAGSASERPQPRAVPATLHASFPEARPDLPPNPWCQLGHLLVPTSNGGPAWSRRTQEADGLTRPHTGVHLRLRTSSELGRPAAPTLRGFAILQLERPCSPAAPPPPPGSGLCDPLTARSPGRSWELSSRQVTEPYSEPRGESLLPG